jgi:uncharacterized damage-inducible protein DinB
MQPEIGALCQSHLEFMQWADCQFYDVLTQAPADQVGQDRGSSFKSLFNTLNHVYLAEMVWISRIEGNPATTIADLNSPADMAALGEAWPGLHQRWTDWGKALDDWAKPMAIRGRFGEFELPYWKLVMHLMNHGSYHRGQLATMMRQAGLKPPSTDLMMFYRSKL